MPLSEKPLYLELTKHTLLVMRAAGTSIEIFRECALDNKPAVEETLSAADPDWKTNGIPAVTALAPLPLWWHLSSPEEATRYRSESAFREFSAKLPHALSGELELTSCHAADGTLISPQGSAPWILGISTAEALAATRATAATWKIAPASSESSTLSHVGGIVTALRLAGSGAVVLWDLGLDRSQLFLLTPRGVEAIVPCAAGFDAIFAAVQTAIGLKFRAAAARLFFNETYDFSEIGAQVAAPIAAALKDARAKFPGNSQGATLACTNLTGKQAWFVRETALAAGSQPWTPDMRLLSAQLKLQFSDGEIEPTLTSSALGLLHLVAGQAHRTTAWHPTWSQAGALPLSPSTPPLFVTPPPAAVPPPVVSPAPVTPAPAIPVPVPVVVAAPAPVAAKPIAPAVVVAATVVAPPAAKALVVPPAPPVPKSAAAAPKPAAVVPPAPAPAPAPKPVPAPAAKAAPTPAASNPAVAAKPTPAPAGKGQAGQQKSGKGNQASAAKNAAAAKAVEPSPTAAVAAKPVAAPGPSPLVYPALGSTRSSKKSKKGSIALFVGLAAAVILAIGGFMWKSAEDAKAVKVAAEKVRIEAAAEKLRVDAAREKAEADAKAKAEAARIQREAEAAAAAKAREATVRQQLSQQQEAERIAKSPGTLVIATSPNGASVSVDGAAAQKSPLTLNDLAPGAHRVRITLTGHDPVELPFEIKGTQTTDLGVIPLERIYGTVNLTSQPEGLEFSVRPVVNILGLARTGRTPATLDDVEPGEYLVTFSHAPWKDQTQTLSVAKRAAVKASAAFSDSVIRFTSTPSGATVKRNGAVLGTTPFTLQEPAQKADYIFSLAGYEDLSVPGENAASQVSDLKGTLRRVDRLAQAGEVKQQPKALEQPGPQLTAEQRRMTADIVIAVTIGRDGKQRDMVITKASNKEIAQLCVQALNKWKFQPAVGIDDQPVSVRVSIPFRIGAN